MKYAQPVWRLMHACALEMPAEFRYEDVSAWFQERYPAVSDSTIRSHLAGLTDGGRPKSVQFVHRRPIFQRVAQGRYTVIAEALQDA
jgi:hypothetical protein